MLNAISNALSRRKDGLVSSRGAQSFEFTIAGDQDLAIGCQLSGRALKQPIAQGLLTPFLQKMMEDLNIQVVCTRIQINGEDQTDSDLLRPIGEFCVPDDACQIKLWVHALDKIVAARAALQRSSSFDFLKRLSLTSIFLEGSRHGEEKAPAERVASWLQEILVGTSSSFRKRSDPRIAGSVGSVLSGSLSSGSTRPRSHSKEYTRSTSLWVLPEAMATALSGELFKEPLMISDSAKAEALACLDTWDYDTLALQKASGGHALLLVGEALFEWHKLHEPCHVDREVLHRFLRALEACYGGQEYHNAMHAADVALGVHYFIVNFGLTARLTKLELLAALVGAFVHDFNHPGTNNRHEVRAGTERALTHTDAILERHHLHSTFTLLAATPAFDLFGAMPTDDEEACRKLIVDMVLATDLKMHFDIISTLRTLAAQHGHAAVVSAEALRKLQCFGRSTGGEQRGVRAERVPVELSERAEWTSPFQVQALVGVPLLLAVALKFADLGHSFKPFHLHKQWTERITDEFWALGDRERQLGIALSPLCDRHTDCDVPESQVGFFKFVCVPFYSIVADLIDPTMLPWLRVQAHLTAWEELSQREAEGGRATSGGDGGGGDDGVGEGGGGDGGGGEGGDGYEGGDGGGDGGGAEGGTDGEGGGTAKTIVATGRDQPEVLFSDPTPQSGGISTSACTPSSVIDAMSPLSMAPAPVTQWRRRGQSSDKTLELPDV